MKKTIEKIKQKIRNRTRYLQRIGAIKKADICEECRKNKAQCNHHDTYNRADKVKRVCYSCHSKIEWAKRKLKHGNNNRSRV